MKRTAYLYDDIFLEHDTGWGHPEKAERLVKIHKKISSSPYYKELIKIKPSLPDMKHIETIHSPDYIRRVKKEIEGGISYPWTVELLSARWCGRGLTDSGII